MFSVWTMVMMVSGGLNHWRAGLHVMMVSGGLNHWRAGLHVNLVTVVKTCSRSGDSNNTCREYGNFNLKNFRLVVLGCIWPNNLWQLTVKLSGICVLTAVYITSQQCHTKPDYQDRIQKFTGWLSLVGYLIAIYDYKYSVMCITVRDGFLTIT